jgi:hypothetical protein
VTVRQEILSVFEEENRQAPSYQGRGRMGAPDCGQEEYGPRRKGASFLVLRNRT